MFAHRNFQTGPVSILRPCLVTSHKPPYQFLIQVCTSLRNTPSISPLLSKRLCRFLIQVCTSLRNTPSIRPPILAAMPLPVPYPSVYVVEEHTEALMVVTWRGVAMTTTARDGWLLDLVGGVCSGGGGWLGGAARCHNDVPYRLPISRQMPPLYWLPTQPLGAAPAPRNWLPCQPPDVAPFSLVLSMRHLVAVSWAALTAPPFPSANGRLRFSFKPP